MTRKQIERVLEDVSICHGNGIYEFSSHLCECVGDSLRVYHHRDIFRTNVLFHAEYTSVAEAKVIEDFCCKNLVIIRADGCMFTL